MLIFLDDSGDPGFQLDKGSSKIFVIALVIFDDDLDTEETGLKIKRLRQRLKKSDRFEFKFNKSSKKFRIEFLKTVASCKFRIQAVVIQKNKISDRTLQKSQRSFYRHAIMLALKYSNGKIKNARLKLDGRGPRQFRRQLTVYLRKQLNKAGDKIFENLKFENSRNNVLIQLADMIAGTIHRSFSDKTDAQVYRKIIKKREEKVWIFSG